MTKLVLTCLLASVPATSLAQSDEFEELKLKVAQLTITVSLLQNRVQNLEASNDALTERLDFSQALTVELSRKLERVDVSDDGRDMFITGANLHIVNGEAATATANGYGNLILGYNEETISYPFYDASGTGVVASGPSVRTGSHNLVVGDGHSYTSYAGVVAGQTNRITQPYASITGGFAGMATGMHSSVGGGERGYARGAQASVAGGYSNRANGKASHVSGGYGNSSNGDRSSVSGGQSNQANGQGSTVLGGLGNKADGKQASVVGGYANKANAAYSAMVAGAWNKAEKDGAVVVGGIANTAEGSYAAVLGGRFNSAAGSTSAVLGGSSIIENDVDGTAP